MYSHAGDASETILMQKNKNEDGAMWILGPNSFRVYGLSKSRMHVSTIIIANDFGTSTLPIPSVAIVQLQPSDDIIFLLLDFEDDIFVVVGLSNTYMFPFRNINSTSSKIHVDPPKSLYISLYMRLARQGTLSQHPPLHAHPSSISLNILDALKHTKYRKRSKSKIAFVDFNNIELRDDKYLPSYFDSYVLFVLTPI